MAASIKDIVNSCLSLANNNDGLFKSEKQAKFLSGFFVDGSLAASVAYSFGEFNGCIRRVDYVIKSMEQAFRKLLKMVPSIGKIHLSRSANKTPQKPTERRSEQKKYKTTTIPLLQRSKQKQHNWKRSKTA